MKQGRAGPEPSADEHTHEAHTHDAHTHDADTPDLAQDSKLLRLIGLGARGGLVSIGVELTRKAVLSNGVHVAILAADVSRHSKDKIVPLLLARGVSMIEMASASALGRAVGREATAVVGVLDAKLARGIFAAHEDIRRKG